MHTEVLPDHTRQRKNHVCVCVCGCTCNSTSAEDSSDTAINRSATAIFDNGDSSPAATAPASMVFPLLVGAYAMSVPEMA
eukprot:3184399-Rhodomonas_salina.1